MIHNKWLSKGLKRNDFNMKKYVWDVSDESDAMNRCPK